MNIPPYFNQEKQSTCSLAVLRMCLQHFGITVSETELEEKVIGDYGKKFSNIWNPTIAKLACEYGIHTILSAEWPVLKPDILPYAVKEYRKNPQTFDVKKYENPDDADSLPEPLPLAYKELFQAVEKGCEVEYGNLSEEKIKKLLSDGYLMQTSIKLHLMYPGRGRGFHSILIYKIDRGEVYYHDPFRGKSLHCSMEHLLKATTDVGVFIVFFFGGRNQP